jgi:hypothetical protein
MKSVNICLLLIVMSVSFNCGGQKIPDAWQPGMKFEASYGGGMMYYSYKIVIQAGTSYMNIESQKGKEHYERNFTDQELNDILAFLAKHEFDKFKSKDNGFAHDKATETLMLIWNNKVLGATESASVRIIESQRENFNLNQAYIESLFKKE